LTYVAGILPNTTVWTSDTAPLPPKKWSGKGRPPKLLRRDCRFRSKPPTDSGMMPPTCSD